MKKPTASTAVVRVKRLAVPRLDMKPAPPPMPRPPPSDFCNNTVAISDRNDHQMDDDNDGLHLDLPSQAQNAGVRLVIGLAGFEFARCYTIGRGIVTPGMTAAPLAAS